jgi:hypothetical protein
MPDDTPHDEKCTEEHAERARMVKEAIQRVASSERCKKLDEVDAAA